jgi:hypothetical protein
MPESPENLMLLLRSWFAMHTETLRLWSPGQEHQSQLQFMHGVGHAPMFTTRTSHHTQALLQEHKLDQETELFKSVDDFGWIKAVQSPNWSVLPEEGRMQAVSEPQRPHQS